MWTLAGSSPRLQRPLTLKRLRLEVSDAKGKGRKKPRKDQYSLPAQRTSLPFDFSPDEYTVLLTAPPGCDAWPRVARLSQVRCRAAGAEGTRRIADGRDEDHL